MSQSKLIDFYALTEADFYNCSIFIQDLNSGDMGREASKNHEKIGEILMDVPNM
jgi:hypothetical protein